MSPCPGQTAQVKTVVGGYGTSGRVRLPYIQQQCPWGSHVLLVRSSSLN